MASIGGLGAFHHLKWRMRRPAYWAAFMGMFLPFVALDIWEESKSGLFGHPSGMISILFTPLLYFAGMVWFSASPWQFGGGGRKQSTTWLWALLFAEAYMVGTILLDAQFQSLAGKPSHALALIPTQTLFHAPAMVLVGYVIATRERLVTLNEALLVQAREAQTRALQGQLHPHVLFNALNGVAELIYKKSDQAEESVRHLSDLLRKVLDAADNPEYCLQDERNILEHYLNMESLRLGKRLRLGWDWDSDLGGMRLPPLLLQPLVENALKHGVAPCREGGELRIQARREGPQAVLCVRNTGMPLGAPRKGKGTSIGLVNLQSRLELAFDGAARFSLASDLGWTVAELRLPWGPSPNVGELNDCA